MASKKPARITRKKGSISRNTAAPVGASRSTPVRNSPVPRTRNAVAAKTFPAITHELIAQRAYLISLSGAGGSEQDNWYRAERELRAGA